MQSIECSELVEIISGRCGLIVGPGLTGDSNHWPALNDSASLKFGCEKGSDLFTTLESAVEGLSIIHI